MHSIAQQLRQIVKDVGSMKESTSEVTDVELTFTSILQSGKTQASHGVRCNCGNEKKILTLCSGRKQKEPEESFTVLDGHLEMLE